MLRLCALVDLLVIYALSYYCSGQITPVSVIDEDFLKRSTDVKNTVFIMEGRTLLLQCTIKPGRGEAPVDDIDDPAYTWVTLDADQLTARGVSIHTNGDMVITDIQFDYSGQYTCTMASRGVPSLRHVFVHHVVVYSFPDYVQFINVTLPLFKCEDSADDTSLDAKLCGTADPCAFSSSIACQDATNSNKELIKMIVQLIDNNFTYPACSAPCMKEALVKYLRSKLPAISYVIKHWALENEYKSADIHPVIKHWCKRGFRPFEDLVCLPCLPGTTTLYEEVKCHPCARGTFQPLWGGHECLTCPHNAPTPGEGTALEVQCAGLWHFETLLLLLRRRPMVLFIVAVIMLVKVGALIVVFIGFRKWRQAKKKITKPGIKEEKILLDDATNRAGQSKSALGNNRSNFSVDKLCDSLTKIRNDVIRGKTQFAHRDIDQPSQLSLKSGRNRSNRSPIRRSTTGSVNSILLNPKPAAKAAAATPFTATSPHQTSQSKRRPAPAPPQLYHTTTAAFNTSTAASLLIPPPPPPPPLPPSARRGQTK